MFFIRDVILPAKYRFAISFTLAAICFVFPAYAQKKPAAGTSKTSKNSKTDPKLKSKDSKDSKDNKDLKTAKDTKKTDKKSQTKTAQNIVKDKVTDKKLKSDKSKTASKIDKNKSEKLSKTELARQADKDKKRKDDRKKEEEERKREDARLAKLKKEKELKEELAREAERKRKESRKREEEDRRREEARLAKIRKERLRRQEIARKAEEKRREALRKQQLEEDQEKGADDDVAAYTPPAKKEVVVTDTLPKPSVKKPATVVPKSVTITENTPPEEVKKEEIKKEVAVRKRSFEKGLRAETIENIANDDITGEDLEARKAAINALGNRAGTVVVMEPQTGKVLTIVNQEWGIRKGFKPCSTIKLVTGVAGLNEKVITPQGDLRSRNMRIGLDDALAHSNNSYFQSAGSSVGNEKMIQYAKTMGLGEQTGINAEGENPGKLPYGNSNVRIYSHGDDFEVTPLQLAVMVSAISNGGKLVVPRIPKDNYERSRFQGYMRGEVKVPQANLQRVLPGMLGAVNYGTAGRAYDDSLNIAGKTGSCIGGGSWLGLFASVAPVVDPKLSVVVITRGQGERGKYASAIAGKIYKALGNRIYGPNRNFTAKSPLVLKPQQKVTARNSALLDNDEGEETDEGDSNKAVQKPQSVKPNPRKGEEITKKPDSGSLFDPVVIEVNRGHQRPRVVAPNQR